MYITVHKALAKSLEKGILICRPDSVLRPARKKKPGGISHETSSVSKKQIRPYAST